MMRVKHADAAGRAARSKWLSHPSRSEGSGLQEVEAEGSVMLHPFCIQDQQERCPFDSELGPKTRSSAGIRTGTKLSVIN